MLRAASSCKAASCATLRRHVGEDLASNASLQSSCDVLAFIAQFLFMDEYAQNRPEVVTARAARQVTDASLPPTARCDYPGIANTESVADGLGGLSPCSHLQDWSLRSLTVLLAVFAPRSLRK